MFVYNTRAMRCLIVYFVVVSCQVCCADFDSEIRPLLSKYCFQCHGNEDASGDVNFQAIDSRADIDKAFEVWESVVDHLKSETMPPADEPQPTAAQRNQVYDWYKSFADNAPSRPGPFRPRRLSVIEYRNSLRSVVGFDLEVDIIEAEQTLAERSMVVKLLPTDPPGQSGFTNDTHRNPLTDVAWDQYSYLADAVLEELFSGTRSAELSALSESKIDSVQPENATSIIRNFITRAIRRLPSQERLATIQSRVAGLDGEELLDALKLELKSILMSPGFLYRGFLMPTKVGRQKVDDFELAERLSYFLWADAPDGELIELAQEGQLSQSDESQRQVDRLLKSPKSRALAEVFASEWLSLSEIELASDNPPVMLALKTQPIDFLTYLFTSDRPLVELIDSRVAFINPHVSRMYGKDAKQMTRYRKAKGIEIEAVAHQQIELKETKERGGILTMPGILAMNRGPIIRGTWILERILGDHLPDPPANVGQVQKNRKGQNLSFRERFEQHRSDATCAVCHDKIDPLGFALQSFSTNGQFVFNSNYKLSKAEKQNPSLKPNANSIDTSGRLPTGETFKDIIELKKILVTKRKRDIVENIVRRTLSYALCRKLTVYDLKTVRTIADDMIESDGTWRDLFLSIVDSMPFRETIVSGEKT